MKLCYFFLLLAVSSTLSFSQNQVTTYAGNGFPGFLNGDTTTARFNQPFGLTLDAEGNLYIADGGNNRIRKIDADGLVTTFAGSGFGAFQDGPANLAWVNSPTDMCFDAEGNMYIADFLNHRIRKVDTDGMVTTVAGSGFDGYADGPAEGAFFNYPRGICIDNDGNIYVGDSWNHRIRKIDTAGMVTTYAGGGTSIGVQSPGDYVDANGEDARFWTPTEVKIDGDGNLFVVDPFNHRIRKIDTDRNVTTVAGSGDIGPDNGGFANGAADEAIFDTPTTLFIDGAGNIYVGDGFNNQVRKIDAEGNVSTFAGSGIAGFVNDADTLAQFDFARGVTIDQSRNIMYVADYNNHAIRKVWLEDEATNVETIYLSENIRIYPNPANDSLHLNFGNEQIGKAAISILTVDGKTVLEQIALQQELSLDIGDLASGVYFVQITTENQQVRKQFVVK